MIRVTVKADNKLSSCCYSVGEAYTSVKAEYAYVLKHARRVGYSAYVSVINTITGESFAGTVKGR